MAVKLEDRDDGQTQGRIGYAGDWAFGVRAGNGREGEGRGREEDSNDILGVLDLRQRSRSMAMVADGILPATARAR